MSEPVTPAPTTSPAPVVFSTPNLGTIPSNTASSLQELGKVETIVVKDVKADAAVAKSFFDLHTRIVLAIVILFASFFAVYKVANHISHKDRAVATATQKVAQAQADKNKVLASQVAQAQAQNTQVTAQVNQQNAALDQAAKARAAALKKQQEIDSDLAVPELSHRWAEVEKVDPSTVTPTSQGILVTPETAHTTVSQLEEIPALQQSVADGQIQNENLQKVIASSTVLNTQLTAEVTGLNKQVTDDSAACKANTKALKAEARKGKLKAFGIGFGTGYVAGLLTRIVVK